MMSQGMKGTKKREAEVADKNTNIKCSRCGEIVGVVAAGYTVVLSKSKGAARHTGLCKCGNRMVYSIVRG